MDSMRSLNSSLPTSISRKYKPYPSASLHQAFKAAAFSVTQLYKAATVDEDAARSAGYQDAIDELLVFLDRENLGLGDGEGWRVRQWATERLTPEVYASESDAEDENEPRRKEKQSTDNTSESVNRDGEIVMATTPTDRLEDEPLLGDVPPSDPTSTIPARQSEMFLFTANTLPSSMDSTPNDRSNRLSRSVRLNLRPALRRQSRDRAASTGNLPSPIHGSGTKRRSPSHSDVFDFAGFANYGHGNSQFPTTKRRRRAE